jgi:hypothetical protein
MALSNGNNAVRGRQFVLDTAEIVTTDKVRVKSIRWYSKSASAGDDISIEDNNGDKIWESVATASNYVEAQDYGPNGIDFDGLELAVIDSGTVYITYA